MVIVVVVVVVQRCPLWPDLHTDSHRDVAGCVLLSFQQCPTRRELEDPEAEADRGVVRAVLGARDAAAEEERGRDGSQGAGRHWLRRVRPCRSLSFRCLFTAFH